MASETGRRSAASKWKRYTIMHMDRHVASIRDDGTCTIYYPSFMPYNLYLEKAEKGDLDTRLNNLENFYHWCASRVLTLDRVYAKEILNSIGQLQAVTDRDRAQIAIAYHGLCMTDVYWIRGDRENIHFSDINLFQHSLSDAFVDVSLRGKQMTVQNARLLNPLDAAGNVSVSGVAPKAWIRRDGVFFLMKDGSLRDVRAEILASRVAQCFSAEQVVYSEGEYDKMPVSRSRLMTSPERSIVSMEAMDIYAANHELSLLEMILNMDAYGYYMMNIIDYLVGNTDRHWGNWGFLVDNRNNKPLKLHPLMDFNKAFSAYDTVDGTLCQTVENHVSQLEAALDAVRHIGLNRTSEIDPVIFDGTPYLEMFRRRLHLLEEADVRRGSVSKP